MTAHHRIDVSKVGDVTVVRFVDKTVLDESSIHELGQELFGLVDAQNGRKMVLNFSNVEFISSATLGKLIVQHPRCIRSLNQARHVASVEPAGLQGGVAPVALFDVQPQRSRCV